MSSVRKQNDAESIKILAAQRALYSSAKKWWGAQLVLNMIFLPLASIFAIKNTNVASFVAVGSVATLLVNGLIWLVIRQRVGQAAEIQEKFDSIILKIPLNPLLLEPDGMAESVESWSAIYFKRHSNQLLLDWYASSLISMNQNKATLTGQRINSWWDNSLRNAYTYVLVVVTIVIATGLVYFGLANDLTLKDFVLSIIVPFVPMFQLVVVETFRNYQAAKTAEKNLTRARHLLSELRRGNGVNVTDIRGLQDSIFLHRTTAPLVFDFVYFISRKKKELTMRRSSK